MFRSNAEVCGELSPCQVDPSAEKLDFVSVERGWLTNDRMRDQFVKCSDRRNNDFFMAILANPDRHVDQLDIVESRLGIHDCFPPDALNGAAFNAATFFCSESIHVSAVFASNDRESAKRRLQRNDYGQWIPVIILAANFVLPVLESFVPFRIRTYGAPY